MGFPSTFHWVRSTIIRSVQAEIINFKGIRVKAKFINCRLVGTLCPPFVGSYSTMMRSVRRAVADCAVTQPWQPSLFASLSVRFYVHIFLTSDLRIVCRRLSGEQELLLLCLQWCMKRSLLNPTKTCYLKGMALATKYSTFSCIFATMIATTALA